MELTEEQKKQFREKLVGFVEEGIAEGAIIVERREIRVFIFIEEDTNEEEFITSLDTILKLDHRVSSHAIADSNKKVG